MWIREQKEKNKQEFNFSLFFLKPLSCHYMNLKKFKFLEITT